tara:strand:+ start:239 stop:577 length:339 start_codon:yes stop_codon:yes gene_type:complete
MKRILLPLLAALALPTAVNAELARDSQISHRDKAGWTGGYGYGFIITICEARRLNLINDSEFNYLGKRVINTYRDKLAAEYYSEEATPLIYRLEDERFLKEACIKFNNFLKD